MNIALLGCGRMGEVHGEAYAALAAGVRVFYVDADVHKASLYADRYGGAGTLPTWQAAVADTTIDAVDNCLPDFLHVEPTLAALHAGQHVLLEKPMAHTLADADRLLAASRHSGRYLMVAENFRFLPHLERAREIIGAGTLGDIFLIEVHHFESLQPRGWRTEARPEDGVGGVLIDVGHHFVDMAVQLGGPIAWVFAQFAQKTHPHFSGEDTAVLSFGYASGVIGQLTLSIGTPGAPPKPTFIVCGTRASLYFDWQSGLWMGEGRAFAPTRLILGKAPEAPDSFTYWGESIHAGVCAFVGALSRGTPVPVPAEAGRHVLAVVLAAHRSAQERQVVTVAQSRRQSHAWGHG